MGGGAGGWGGWGWVVRFWETFFFRTRQERENETTSHLQHVENKKNTTVQLKTERKPQRPMRTASTAYRHRYGIETRLKSQHTESDASSSQPPRPTWIYTASGTYPPNTCRGAHLFFPSPYLVSITSRGSQKEKARRWVPLLSPLHFLELLY